MYAASGSTSLLTVPCCCCCRPVALLLPGEKKELEARCEQIRQAMEQTTSDYDREKLQERLAKLSGGSSVGMGVGLTSRGSHISFLQICLNKSLPVHGHNLQSPWLSAYSQLLASQPASQRASQPTSQMHLSPIAATSLQQRPTCIAQCQQQHTNTTN